MWILMDLGGSKWRIMVDPGSRSKRIPVVDPRGRSWFYKEIKSNFQIGNGMFQTGYGIILLMHGYSKETLGEFQKNSQNS